jgi:ACR3 family arsenite efflux pump ArsB
MDAALTVPAPVPVKRLKLFERHLSLWVALCIVVGMALGRAFPSLVSVLRGKVPHSVAAPGALIGASNFFELAVATAITLFGPESGSALATVYCTGWFDAGLPRCPPVVL